VVSTRFEGLPRLFPATPYVHFVSTNPQMDRALDEAPRAGDVRARKLVEDLGWEAVVTRIENHLKALVQ